MNFMCWLITSPVLGFIGGVIGGIITLFVNSKFSPGLHLRILGNWIDAERIILRIEVENKSQVRVVQKNIKLQILEYPAGTKSLSEWVPFESDKVRVGEEPLSWRDPIEIFQTNRCLNPGEITAIERIERLSSKDRLFHVGLQFKSKSGVPFLPLLFLGHKEQWTTTTIFVHQDVA
jgi:hypothetical protein